MLAAKNMNNLNYFDCDMVHPILDRVTKCTETVLPFWTSLSPNNLIYFE